jgi:DNA invertase Pin-like site-specific DNA recombinase
MLGMRRTEETQMTLAEELTRMVPRPRTRGRIVNTLPVEECGTEAYREKRRQESRVKAAKIRVLREDGMQTREIAAQLGIDRASVSRLLRQYP